MLDVSERLERENDEHEDLHSQAGEIEKEIDNEIEKAVRREGPLPFSDFGRWHADRYSVS